MATTAQIKKAIAANDTLRERIVLEGILKIVEEVKSVDPTPSAEDSKLVDSFFTKRAQKAQTYATAAITNADGTIDFSKVPNIGNILLGVASDTVDRAVIDAGSNPWEPVPDEGVDAAAQSVIDSMDEATVKGAAELSFNGLAGITGPERNKAMELGKWTHPFTVLQG